MAGSVESVSTLVYTRSVVHNCRIVFSSPQFSWRIQAAMFVRPKMLQGQSRERALCLYKVSGTQLRDGLYITSVQPEDTGSYVCEAKNEAGSVESESTLSIQG